jgi:hypothetical protein
MLSKIGRLSLWLAAGVAVLGVGALAWARWPVPPPGRMVDVGGFRLHLVCEGSGAPAVILDSGSGTRGFPGSGCSRRSPDTPGSALSTGRNRIQRSGPSATQPAAERRGASDASRPRRHSSSLRPRRLLLRRARRAALRGPSSGGSRGIGARRIIP